MYTLEVVPGFYQITDRYANMFLIAGKQLTLIDAGFRGSARHITDLIQRLGRLATEIGTVFLTHNHLDHTGGLPELRAMTRLKVAAHRADVFIPEDLMPYPAGNLVGLVLRTPGLATLRRHFVLARDEVDIILDGGEEYDLNGGMKVVPTPGHTAGSVSFYFPASKMLVVGDALNKRGNTLRLPLKTVSTNLKQAEESIRTMASLDVEILCLGHGRPIIRDAGENLQKLQRKLSTYR